MAALIPLEPGNFYHIYNRGNNRENLFVEERNYRCFLGLYAHHVPPVAETFAYCLLPNHFHLLVRIRDPQPDGAVKPSQAFSNWCNAYSRSFNRRHGRTGALFQRPFQRIAVTTPAYFTRLMVYIHHNPQRHGFVTDFREWPYSSYHMLLSAEPTSLARAAVIDWFETGEGFATAHSVATEDTALGWLTHES